MKEGWEYKKLGEICDIFGRIGFRGYTRDDYVNTIDEGAISLSPSNIINNQLDFSNCTYITWDKYNQSPEIKIYEGDVIFVKTASVGKCAFVSVLPHESTINPQFVVFKNISIFNRFLFYELLSPAFQYKVKRITSGTSVPTITQKGLSELLVSFPNKNEQERIVAELDLLSSIIEKKKAQLKELDQLAQSIFYDMFGDPITNEKGWEVKKLGEVCIIERGGSPRPIEQYLTDDENGINWIKIGDATEGGMVISSTKQKIIPEGVKKSRFVHKGDFLLSNSMSFGKPYILGVDGCIHDGWLVIQDPNEIFNKIYLYYFLGSPQTYESFRSMAVGGVVNNLNKDMVKRVFIAIPNPTLQQEFADKVEAIERQKTLIQQSIDETQTLFDSRMDYWFG